MLETGCTFLLNHVNLPLYLHQHTALEFVEASSSDRVWGIGLHISDKDAEDQSKWRGENLLGKALTRVRKWIRNSENGSKQEL